MLQGSHLGLCTPQSPTVYILASCESLQEPLSTEQRRFSDEHGKLYSSVGIKINIKRQSETLPIYQHNNGRFSPKPMTSPVIVLYQV